MKNDRSIVEKIRNVGFENCYLSEITILELLYGVANSESTKKPDNLKRLQQFEESFKVRILPIRPVFEIFSAEKLV